LWDDNFAHSTKKRGGNQRGCGLPPESTKPPLKKSHLHCLVRGKYGKRKQVAITENLGSGRKSLQKKNGSGAFIKQDLGAWPGWSGINREIAGLIRNTMLSTAKSLDR